ncbi:HERV-H LTR-associating protein 2 isoform 2-T20 [Dama dama]|uniref:HERV-H LTR-associating protein 2 isoform X2 n=1 Tax=Dama dama TaxID=30532 RepID=UPI002A36BBF5|nr:HERV-H LTR-associating protein 2 isoform X2 [Dama dama]
MKAEAVLCFLLTLIPAPCGSQASSSHVSVREQIVTGRLREDVILPCSFESGPNVVIHWKNRDTNIYSYYKDRDQLETQDPRYVNRLSLFPGEIYNGNASLCFRRLTIYDEGIYICYVETSLGTITKRVVLQVVDFVTPVMEYEKKTTNSFLICTVFSVFPYPNIKWKVDNNTTISDKKERKEDDPFGPFHVNSRVNITGSNSSYQCAIENPLLKQTWTGRWTMKDVLHKMESENVLLSCKPENNFSPPNQDFTVTWSRVENGSSLLLACFKNSSQETLISQPQISWKEEPINSRDFSLTLKDLRLSDSGEYLCNITSNESTSLTMQTLHVASQRATAGMIVPVLVAVVLAVLLLSVATRAIRSRRCIGFHKERHLPTNPNSSSAGTSEENVPLKKQSSM